VLILALLTVLGLTYAPPLSTRSALAQADLTPVSETAEATPSDVSADPLTATPTPLLARNGSSPTMVLTVTVSPTVIPSATSTPLITSSVTLTPAVTLAPMRAVATLTATTPLTVTRAPYAFNTHPELPRYIYVDQASQHMYVFERGQLLRDIPCSTGLPDDDKYTPDWEGKVGYFVGTFFSFGTYADLAWYLFQSQGAILVHTLPYTTTNGVKYYQDRDALGVRPSSHGCIRIAPEDAVWLTKWDPEGVLMTVTSLPPQNDRK
jgi:lipoprotein-anchoring transpeptidase ErfK/SrfK